NPRERELGADILGQLGVPERVFQDDCVATLIGMLETENTPDALASVCIALGHQQDPRAVQPLSRLKRHPDPDVRYALVHGLLTQTDPLAVETLIELSGDEDEDVRDWATFGLGSQIDLDTPQIRHALVQRLDDPHDDT